MENKNTSRKIRMNRLNNLRDLGGIRTRDDREIVNGRLYRSGQLFFADKEDIERLKDFGINRIIDFRTRAEREEKPDPVIAGEINMHIPIFREVFAGVTRDKESQEKAFEMMLRSVKEDPLSGIRYMEETYVNMVRDDYSISQYASFLREVADNEDGAVLWHCTAGKDRAGFATVLLLEILGVSRQDIMEDYLDTNWYLEGEMNDIINMMKARMDLGGAEYVIKDFFGAKEEYLKMVYEYVDEHYGGMDAFIKDKMGITDEERAKIRGQYLL